MRTAAKVLGWIAISLVAVPLLAFVTYDLVQFQPRRAEIKRVLSLATEDERSPPILVRQLVNAAYGDRFAALASRHLMDELQIQSKSTGMLHWHAISALWWALTALHLSEQEQLTLIASRSYMGNGVYGFSAGGKALFGRPLSSLSLSEAAAVVAVVHAPSVYLGSPKRLAKRRDLLIEKAQRGF